MNIFSYAYQAMTAGHLRQIASALWHVGQTVAARPVGRLRMLKAVLNIRCLHMAALRLYLLNVHLNEQRVSQCSAWA